MKKILLGASALSIAGFAGAASAQEVTAQIGGFMTSGFGYFDTSEDVPDATNFTVINNAEVIFNFRLVADNGITFGAKVEFEASGTSENADEYVGTVRGSFGTIEVGREDGAGDRLAGAAAGATAFTAAGDAAGILFDYNDSLVGVVSTDGGDTGDQLKVTYFTPTFAGFQAGVSFTPGGDSRSGRAAGQGEVSTNETDNDTAAFELGAKYSNDFGGFGLDVGGAYIAPLESDTFGHDGAFIVSANVGFGGFTVGGIYGLQFDGATSASGAAEDTGGYAIGANYETGPWNFGLQWAQGVDNADDVMGLSAGADYALAPGVTVGVVLEYGEDDTSVAEEAYAGGVFMNLDF
ncbi:porin [Rubrimonas cliftonensis]|uniref:Outer membrane protein (Porin) n=1 Tax=Rubrimonas cliftonensis TaxID=89524 RepID=A0A1H4ED60_9RHOB|nr:porin [Rubrimonas cliftonensis]SEA82991.1 Outer membrane protein (porin) [Rubrimonas cliftonensis]